MRNLTDKQSGHFVFVLPWGVPWFARARQFSRPQGERHGFRLLPWRGEREREGSLTHALRLFRLTPPCPARLQRTAGHFFVFWRKKGLHMSCILSHHRVVCRSGSEVGFVRGPLYYFVAVTRLTGSSPLSLRLPPSLFSFLRLLVLRPPPPSQRRKMVASNTLQRYPETFDLAASAVNGALRGATVEGVDLFAKVLCADLGLVSRPRSLISTCLSLHFVVRIQSACFFFFFLYDRCY